MSLRGKVALITYGEKNTAVERARELAKEGVQLALHYNSAKGRDITLSFRDDLQRKYVGLRVSVHGGDIGTAAAVEQLFSAVLRAHEQIDIVVNAAGAVLQKPMSQAAEVDHCKMFAYTVFVDEQRRQSVGRFHEALRKLPPL